MAATTETPVPDVIPYGPPAISGLFDLLDQRVRISPEMQEFLPGHQQQLAPKRHAAPCARENNSSSEDSRCA